MQLLRKAGPYILVFAAYVLTGKAGLALASVNASATAVWPPTGIALAAVLILGPRIWPAIFLGAFVTNETTAGTTLTSLLIASGNTLEALLGGYLVKRFAGGRSVFEHGQGILLFVLFAGFASTSVAATVGVTTLWLFGFTEGAAYGRLWLTWWLGDAAGAMVVAPVLIFWHARPRVDWSRRKWGELFVLTVLLVVVGWAVFVVSEYPLTFLTVPICLWAAWRFGQREAATATCVLSAVAIWGSAHGLGTFGRHSIHDSLLLLQAFAAVTSIIGLTVGAAVSGRRVAEEGLRRSNEELEERVRARAKDLQLAVDKLTAAQDIVSRSERRLQTIIDAEPACVTLVSLDGHLLDMNRAGLEMSGARDISQLAGRPIVDLVHPDDRQRFLELYRAAGNGSPGRAEFRMVGLDGGERWVDAHAVPFETTNHGPDNPRAVLCVSSDVTERKNLEEQLRQGQKMEAVGLLAGGIAHDFNNLLTAISGYTELVLETVDEADSRRGDLLEVRKAAERAAALTRQLLTFSRKQMVQTRVLDVNALVTDIAKLLRRTIPEHIDLVLDLQSLLDPVRADPGQLEQVLLNLALNAADAMPQGGQLRIATKVVDVDTVSALRHPPMTAGRYVILTVSDTGVGMSEETQSRIFEPFFTTKPPGKGTGLGLATVYGIVKQSGGFISVASQLDRGTTFEVYLPAVHEAIEPALQAAPRTETQDGSETILLAEDDGAVRRLACEVLSRYGYSVLEARDGDEALTIAREYGKEIHLLITDMVMPGLSGRQLADRLTALRPDIRVLYSSGYAESMTLTAGSEGRLLLLAKPYPPAELLHKVRAILDEPA